MRVKLNKTPEEVLEAINASVSLARNLVPDVEWSAEDATRSDPDFLARAIAVAIKAGARTIKLPDKVGYATPETYGRMFREIDRKSVGVGKSVYVGVELGGSRLNKTKKKKNTT